MRVVNVFVTGATGVVGPALAARLLARGHAVRALVRRLPAGLPPAVETVVGSLADADALAEGARGAGAVVHLAAQLHVNVPGAHLDGLYQNVNVDGTRRVVEAARDAGVPRVVFASTINVYGPSAGRAPWTEADAAHPDTLYGRTKLEAEAIVREHPGGVVLRLAAVYGRGMKGNYPALQRVLARGVRWLPGDGTNRRTLVHVDDAAQAFEVALGGLAPGVYNVTDGQVHAFDAVVRSLQEAVGRRPGVRYLPAAWVRAGLAVPAALASAAGRSFPGLALVDKMTEDVAVSGQKLLDASAYRPAHLSLRDGWAT